MENIRAKNGYSKTAFDAYKISVSKIIDRHQKIAQNSEEYYNINDYSKYENNFRISQNLIFINHDF